MRISPKPLDPATVLRLAEQIAQKVPTPLSRWTQRIIKHAPIISAGIIFLLGCSLLMGALLPGLDEHYWIEDWLDVSVKDFSYFVESIIGMLMIILSRSLVRRLDSAYVVAVGLLAFVALLNIFKGNVGDVLIFGACAVVLALAHAQFYRKGALLSEIRTLRWQILVGCIVLAIITLVLLVHGRANIAANGWWRISFSADFPRTIRALTATATVTLVIAFASLLSYARRPLRLPAAEELDTASSIANGSVVATSQMVRLGDKEIMLSEEKNAFGMYGATRTSLVVLGDPVGQDDEATELIWELYDAARERGLTPVFYQTTAQFLPVYIDLGLTAFKLGEAAVVPLSTFDLSEKRFTELRYLHRKGGRLGLTFEVIPASGVHAILPELQRISDAWLQSKTTREKRFALGYFDEKYLTQFRLGIVRCDGVMVGFANIMEGGGYECAIDLMRYLPDTPNGLMDYFFVELMLWAKGNGYQTFNLGLAPLAGLENKQTTLWHLVGSLLYRHGEHFYNFRGLRKFKEKFLPLWEPRYLITRGSVRLPVVLSDIGSLVSGGFRGMWMK